MTVTAVRVRPAMASDTAAMLAITRGVWEGHDYVPYVWDSWLSDPRGYLSVAEIENTVVGLMHVTVQDDGTAWAEGIRVRDDVQARGIGEAMLRDGIAWVRAAGLSRLRLSTYGANPASNGLAQKAGLAEVARLRALSCSATSGSSQIPGIRTAFPSDFEAVWECITNASAARGDLRIYTEGWTAYSLTSERAALLLATHALLVAGSGQVDGLAIATANTQRPALKLGYLVGSTAAKADLARSLIAHAARAGYPRVTATIPVDGDTLQALDAAGLSSESIDEMVVYEMSTGEE
jgi:GNAT superfamily N-acetyltransferase